MKSVNAKIPTKVKRSIIQWRRPISAGPVTGTLYQKYLKYIKGTM